MGTGIRYANASEFVDALVGGGPGVELADVGSGCRAVASALAYDEDASATIGTMLWAVFHRSTAFDEALAEALGPSGDAAKPECFVVRHPLFGGPPRYDLLVLDERMADMRPEVIALPEAGHGGWIEQGWSRVFRRLADRDRELEVWPDALAEAAATDQFRVIVAEPPRQIRVQGSGCVAPSPALAVRRRRDAPEYSSVGVAMRDRGGEVAVTTAWHALGAPADGAEVWIDGTPGTLLASHEISHSAIVRWDGAEMLDANGGRPLKGPLRGKTPRNEPAWFIGAGSIRVHETFVTNWSPDLLLVAPWNQVKVLTSPDSVPGDSGAALIDSEDNLLGFAFSVTAFDEPLQFSTWMWADLVYTVHGLQPLSLAAG